MLKTAGIGFIVLVTIALCGVAEYYSPFREIGMAAGGVVMGVIGIAVVIVKLMNKK